MINRKRLDPDLQSTLAGICMHVAQTAIDWDQISQIEFNPGGQYDANIAITCKSGNCVFWRIQMVSYAMLSWELCRCFGFEVKSQKQQISMMSESIVSRKPTSWPILFYRSDVDFTNVNWTSRFDKRCLAFGVSTGAWSGSLVQSKAGNIRTNTSMWVEVAR